MNSERFLAGLLEDGVVISVSGGKVRLRDTQGVLTQGLRAELAERKEEILSLLRDQHEYAATSFAQNRLWFLDQLVPQAAFYNMPFALRLEGKLNVIMLKESLNEILRRHEALRTTFVTIDGRPFQEIAFHWALELPVIDLRTLAPEEREARMQQLALEEAERPFDLSTGPVIRSVLLWLDQEEYVLLLTKHHIVSDGWSLGVFVSELGALYEAFSKGCPSPLPELPIQYADFALWQRQRLSLILKEQLAYWKQALAGAPDILDMQTDRPRPSIQTYKGASLQLPLPEKLTKALRELSERQDSTLFMVLLAAFNILLYRYTGQTDLVVGSPIANRNQAELEGLIGFFVNTMALRMDLSGNPTFGEALAQARQVALGAFAHQDLPFEKLVEELSPERNLDRSPLFQVAFALQNAPLPPFKLSGLNINLLVSENAPVRFDFEFHVFDIENELSEVIFYNTDLFDSATMRRFGEHYRALLEAIVADPNRRISDFSIMANEEQRQILEAWNDAQTEPYGKPFIQEWFEEYAEQYPDYTAVIFEDQQLTYRQLNQKSNQLACCLRSLGVGPEVLVGVCLERSAEVVVAWFGTLKSGGVYVPIDPAYPNDRLEFMFQDSRVAVILTQSTLLEKIPLHSAKVVCLDKDWDKIQQANTENLPLLVNPDNLAYIIYTSGSTGKPKGSLITHRGLTNIARSLQKTLDIQPGKRVLQFSSLSFDASIFEFVMAFGAGAALCLAPRDKILPGQGLVQLLQDLRINTALLPPSALAVLPSAKFTDLETLIVAGEACPAHLVERWGVGRRFFNFYGPTEITIWATAAECESSHKNPPIGRPILNTQVYVLDTHLQPVPVGIPGELHISGIGLSRGYLNRPELTAERFIPHPFSRTPGARLYKTGDLVRWLPDGNLEFLGRIDDQVKIRGFRIELGEIESVLMQHPLIQECAVIARHDPPAEKRLVAYLVFRSAMPLSVGELRSFLSEKLPDYMIPAVFVFLEKMPLTPNGKINRKGLPLPQGDRTLLGKTFVAPQTPVEQRLADIWKEVLGIEQVGIHDNFFELGGDSILSLQVISRARQAGLHFIPKQLFQYQTIAELAEVVKASSPPQTEAGPVTGPVPLTPIQCWFFHNNFADLHHWNQAFLLEPPSRLDPSILRQSIRHLIGHHDALRLRFSPGETGWQQVNAGDGDPAPFHHLSLQDLPENEIPAAIENETSRLQSSLDLEHGPLIQVAYFDLGENSPGRLFLCIHHLAIDGVSWRVLFEDLLTIYYQLEPGGAFSLPAKSTSFQEWANRLTTYAGSGSPQQELDYWLAQPWEEAAILPKDNPDGNNTVASSDTVIVALSQAETQTLLKDVPGVYRTQINDLLLTALGETLASWAGKPFILIDLEGHGREDLFSEVDLSRTVGWFTSLFPFLLHAEPAGFPATSLISVKEQLRAIPKHGIGYGILRFLSREPRLEKLPRPEVAFNYLGQFDQMLGEKTGWRLAKEPIGPIQSPKGERTHLLQINAAVLDGRLQLSWGFSREVHRRETIERIARVFIETLQRLLSHCLSPEAGGFSPSDFDLIDFTQTELDGLWKKLGQDVEDIYPLSPMQEGMLFHTLLDPGSGLYFEQLCCRLKGELQVEAFKQAWQKLVDRHPILRTGFHQSAQRGPFQVVHRQAKLEVTQEDLRGLSEQEQTRKIKNYLDTDREHGFDLEQPPLMRLGLLRLKEMEWKLIWSNHHGMLDGWSLPLLIREMFVYYEGYSQGKSINLRLPQPYRRFIEWLQQQDRQLAEQFWRKELAGFRTPTPLGIGHSAGSGGAKQSQGRAKKRLSLSANTTLAIQKFARDHQLTFNTLVQGVWALLLGRYSGEREVVFGVTVSGRAPELEGIEEMVGLFINTLPLRVKLDGEEKLVFWLKEIQAHQAELFHYGYSGLTQIQSWSEIPRGVPLFDSLVVFENYPVDPVVHTGKAGLEIDHVELEERLNFPLSLASGLEDGLVLEVNYSSARFDQRSIERLLGHLQTLLENMILDPERKIASLSLLTEAEQQQILVEWNHTYSDYPRNKCIHQLFEEQVERTPEAIALIFEDRHVSYAELNSRANQLAHYLLARDLVPESVIGVCLTRSIEMITALLAILKAGCAYVPLDPSYPPERLAFMLSDSKARVLLTQQTLLRKLPSLAEMARRGVSGRACHVICVDDIQCADAGLSAENLSVEVAAHNLAYVIYTSGSTGAPKGVLGLHRGAVNRLQWMWRVVPFGLGERCCQKTALSFVDSVWEIFGPLLQGIPLALISDEVVKDPDRLIQTLAEQRVTRIVLVPSLLRALLEAPSALGRSLPDLKYCVSSGEALPRDLLQQFRERFPHCILLNLYGSSEVAADATWYDTREWTSQPDVPIGRPIDNMQVYVLDAQLQLAPVGVPGELYISGDGLARGYLGRPDLTAERFILNPFAIQAQDKDRADLPTCTRLYKTGDVARWMADGNIEFLGRSDHQVKLRGYRIELGEIEAQLIQHPAVKEAVVVARANGLNGMHPAELKTLIAYIVPNSDSGNASIGQTGKIISTQEISDMEQLWPQLQEYLKSKLPAYMVPSAFVKMDTLPLTPSGKVDRRALPEPGSMTRGQEPYLAPRDTLEFQLVKIWEELLNVRPISLSDNFFDLGGHSLLALRLAAQIQDQLGRSIPPSSILEGTTIERLANILRNSGTEQRCSPIVHIQPQGSKIPFFCVHPAGGNVFRYAELAKQLGQDQPFYGLEEPYLLGSNHLDQSIQEKAAIYIEAMKAVQPEGPYQLGGWSMGGAVAYEMAQQLQRQGEAINLLVLLDTPAPNHHGIQLSEEEINTYLLLGFACVLKEQYNLPLSITEDLLSLGPDTQIDYLIEQAQTMATPLSNFDHYLRQVYRVYQSHLRALWEYKPQAYAKQILMIQAGEPTRLSFQGLQGMKLQDPELLGVGDPQNWARFTNQPLETFCVPGSHWTMLALPHVQVVAAHLKQYLS